MENDAKSHLLDCESSIRWAACVRNIDSFQKLRSIRIVIQEELNGHIITVRQHPHLHPVRVAGTSDLQGRDDVRHELRHLAEVVISNAPRGVNCKHDVSRTVTTSCCTNTSLYNNCNELIISW